MPPGSDGEYTFALCLSHDVDRIYKTYQYLWNGLQERDPREIAGLLSSKNPYWQFERIMDIEESHGVRSSFNVLVEKHISERPKRTWATKEGWQLFAGRYDVDEPEVASTLRVLDRNGWEIGLHGSYTSSEEPGRFGYEKDRIEAQVESDVVGNRQHYWRLSRPDTWEHLRDSGIKYDTSLGDSTTVQFQHGYDLRRPFDDEFVVFPWSVMDGAIMGSADSLPAIERRCDRLLETARDERTVLVANWHQNVFNHRENRGWTAVYEHLIERAQEMGGWVGPPGELYERIDHPDGTIQGALDDA